MPQTITPAPAECGCRVEVRVDVKPLEAVIHYCRHHYVDPDLLAEALAEDAQRPETENVETQYGRELPAVVDERAQLDVGFGDDPEAGRLGL